MKKILFFTYDFPYPTTSGGKVRAYNLLKYSSGGLGFHLFSFTRKDTQKEDIESIKKLGVKSVTLYKRRSVLDPRNILSIINRSSIFKYLYFEENIAQDLVEFVQTEQIDVVLLESFYTSYYVDILRKTNAKIIFGTENIEHLVYEEYVEHTSSSFLKTLFEKQVKKIKDEEIKALTISDAVLTVTGEEGNEVGKYSNKKSYVIENGITIDNFQYSKSKKTNNKNLLFIGNFTYFPNIEAVKFIKKNLIVGLPDVNFTIIGKKSTQLFDNYRNVVAKEYVVDIKEEYEKADVFIFPVKFGGGTNFKLLEAMASGVPIVGFSQKIESLNAIDGVHFLAANSKEKFIEKINALINDEEIRNKITRNARALVEKNYDWEKIGKKLNSILKTI